MINSCHEANWRGFVRVGFGKLHSYFPQASLVRTWKKQNMWNIKKFSCRKNANQGKQAQDHSACNTHWVLPIALLRMSKTRWNVLSFGPWKSTLNSFVQSFTSSTFQSLMSLHAVSSMRGDRHTRHNYWERRHQEGRTTSSRPCHASCFWPATTWSKTTLSSL